MWTNQKHMDYIFLNIHVILTEMNLSPSILFSWTFCLDFKPDHDACKGQSAAWHFQADAVDFIRTCNFFPAACLKIFVRGQARWAHSELLSHPFPQMVWKLIGNRDYLYFLGKAHSPNRALKNKITPTCSSLHFRKKKEKGSEKVTPATELLRKSVQLTFSHYFNLIYLCQLIFCIYEIQTVLFQPTTFHALVWKKKNNFLRGQRLLPPPWLMLLCPPAAEKAEAIQTWAQPLRAGGGSFEEEQTTNKLHGHYPLCILVLIGVADPCLLIRKGSRKTHKFSQGSQTAWSHIRQLRMLPWAQKQNRA